MKEKEHQHQYGLMTAITMIVGICIGSGIFFKADDILRYTNGNVTLGVIILCLGAFSIIFGSLTMTELAVRTEKSGGVVAYFEEFVSKDMASAFGWFQTFLYLPSITVVVSWVAGIYTLMMFNIQSTLEQEVLLGLVFMSLIYGMNYLSGKLGGRFQVLTTYVKLIPLLGIALLGVFWRPDIAGEVVEKVSHTSNGWLWLAALAPAAFSYEGWNISTSISHEVKNSKRNMPLALIIGPLIVLTVYVLYFVGLTNIVGPDYLLQVGDQAVYQIGQALLGKSGGVIITFFVVISVLGVINGLTMGSIRMPEALATKNMLPYSKKIAQSDFKKKLSPASFKMSLFIAFIWMGIHYLTQKFTILPGSDISEIAIVFSYICYPILYLKVIKMYKNKEITSVFKGVISPIFGMIGCLIIVIGGIFTNPVNVPIFIFICFLFCVAGFIYNKKMNVKR